MFASPLEEQGRFRKQGLVGGGVSSGMGFKFSKAQAILEGKDVSSQLLLQPGACCEDPHRDLGLQFSETVSKPPGNSFFYKLFQS